MSCKCQFPKGVTVNPDGVHELDPCRYVLTERHINVTVEVLTCPVCGSVSIGWIPQENTEDIIMEE
jgi:hypothetical protein